MPSNAHKLTDDQVTYLCKAYLEGKSAAELGRELGVHCTAIRYRLTKNGIGRLNPDGTPYKRLALDEGFFDVIDTEIKAYWLGFLYADGAVVWAKDGRSPYVSLGLAMKDSCHVDLFRCHLKSAAKIHIYHAPPSIMKSGKLLISSGNYGVHLCSKRLCEALMNKGCVPRKSLILAFPTTNQVPAHLLHHFVRGYFDGDGCISGEGPTSYKISMVGTEAFLQGCETFLGQHGIKRVKVSTHENIYQISHGGNHNVDRIYDILYRDATIWLKRKRDRFDMCRAYIMKQPSKIWLLKAPSGKEYKTINLSAFSRKHGMEGNSLRNMVQGKVTHFRGWTLVRSWYDSYENSREHICSI